jgi:uncharacterized protein YacL
MKWLDRFLRDKFRESFKREFSNVYILDTSCLVDGRIVNFFKHTGFNGRVIVPSFVQDEISQMESSKQFVESSKGSRASIVIKELTKQLFDTGRVIQVYEYERNLEFRSANKILGEERLFEDVGKFIGMAKEIVGTVIVISCHTRFTELLRSNRVLVVNINELANDLQDKLFRGEKYSIKLVGLGEEEGQAIGYLNNQVLTVVNKASKYIGQVVPIVIKNIIQRESGRIVFADLQWR